MKERLEKYALLAEIVGGLAIVISLVFVGLQVRQSNSLAATEALNDGTELWTDALVTAFGTEESTAFFKRAINNCEALSMEQRGRFFATLSKFLSAYDNIFNQYESGRLRQEVFVSIATGYYGIVNTPCAQEVLTRDFPLLPPWLLSPVEIDALTGHENEIRLSRFLIE